MSLAELKEKTGLPRSTLHRLVKLLVDEHFWCGRARATTGAR